MSRVRKNGLQNSVNSLHCIRLLRIIRESRISILLNEERYYGVVAKVTAAKPFGEGPTGVSFGHVEDTFEVHAYVVIHKH